MPTRTEFDLNRFPGIVIQHEDAVASTFHLSIKELLLKIATKPKGAELLNQISTNNHNGHAGMGYWGGARLLIKRSTVSGVTIGKAGEEGGNMCVRLNELDASKTAVGCCSYIMFNPNIYVVPNQGPRPPYIGLAHEMVHCLHNLLGEAHQDTPTEESRTVGIGRFSGEAICENVIRAEHDIALRTSY